MLFLANGFLYLESTRHAIKNSWPERNNLTPFLPEEGGQNADGGTLNSHPVLDVQIKDGIIRHTTDIPFSPGSQVEGQNHWQPRYSNMQQHSGEHIISGLVHARFGYDNVGFHLGIKNVTLDFNGILTPEQLKQLILWNTGAK